jgi:hypothetical protein
MAEITIPRTGTHIRKLFEILLPYPDGLQAADPVRTVGLGRAVGALVLHFQPLCQAFRCTSALCPRFMWTRPDLIL